jgi:acetyl esterase/lipase
MPTRWSIDALERLREAGRPIRLLVYPDADHGILRFEEGDDGERRYLGYEPGYLPAQVAWLRYQSGLEERLDLPIGR